MILKVSSCGKQADIPCRVGENLLAILQRAGYNIPANCGGNGKCGKCKVRVLPDTTVLACRTAVSEGMRVEVFPHEGGGLAQCEEQAVPTDGESGYGVAVDIGTTTLAFSVVDLQTGKEYESFGELNRQGIFGADVISRIVSAQNGNAQALQNAVLDQIRKGLRTLSEKYGYGTAKRVCLCGNTTMLHLLLGKDVSGIGKYPFTPVFLHTVRLVGDDLGWDADEVVVLPSVSAYFGADAVAGVLAANCRKNDLFADIGTNGEMLLCRGDEMYAASTAAGPCFEGATIECGTGGVVGAVDKVFIRDGKIAYTAIGGGTPAGICGAGLVDAIAVMLKTGVIDENGSFTQDDDRFYICDNVYVSQSDVRAFQLAKSAVCAGMEVLMQTAGITCDDVHRLYIAGGFGFYVNRENAVDAGLFPAGLRKKIKVLGNAALAGTKQCLVRADAVRRAERLAQRVNYLDLASHPAFAAAYVEGMCFSSADKQRK